LRAVFEAINKAQNSPFSTLSIKKERIRGSFQLELKTFRLGALVAVFVVFLNFS